MTAAQKRQADEEMRHLESKQQEVHRLAEEAARKAAELERQRQDLGGLCCVVLCCVVRPMVVTGQLLVLCCRNMNKGTLTGSGSG